MPYIIQLEKDGLSRIFSGSVSEREIIASTMEMYENSKYDSLKYAISCFLDVEKFDLEFDGVRKLAQLSRSVEARNPSLKVAIVANNSIMKALAALYKLELCDSSRPAQIFDSLQDARRWTQSVTMDNFASGISQYSSSNPLSPI